MDRTYKIRDRSAKVAKRRSRMLVTNRSLKSVILPVIAKKAAEAKAAREAARR